MMVCIFMGVAGAAFSVGLSLTGPQSVGVAAADSPRVTSASLWPLPGADLRRDDLRSRPLHVSAYGTGLTMAPVASHVAGVQLRYSAGARDLRAALLWTRVGGDSPTRGRFPASKLVLRPKVQSSFIHRICPRNDRNQTGSPGSHCNSIPLSHRTIRTTRASTGTRVR